MKSTRKWKTTEVIQYLDSMPDVEEWKLINEALYGYISKQGEELIVMDDDDMRSVSVVKFLTKNGGTYISGTPEKRNHQKTLDG